MSVFKSRPALRWLVPSAAAVAVIGGGAAAGTIVASADSALPDRSAAQLLVDLQDAHVDGLSGTVVQSADLGLPGIAGLLGKASGAAGSGTGSLTSLISGSNTARVWYAGEESMRVALVGGSGETDVIRNGPDLWQWNSADNTGTHLTLPADGSGTTHAVPSTVPSSPQEAADAALAAIDPTTKVETTGAAKVAGRDAYELVLSPRDTDSLIGQVRLAIDAEQHIPLRVDVYAKNTTKPAVRVAFEQISFTVPDAEQFTFNPPPNAKITEAGETSLPSGSHAASGSPSAAKSGAEVIGKGWTSIFSTTLPDFESLSKDSGKTAAGSSADLDPQALLDTLPEVSGSWGKGRLLSGSLFSVLITDDGRVLAGAVTPEALYKAL
ncbi:sigma-E factor regulatory protein RseB domain-containing protein [Actinoplanes sp. NPDC051851]|uniref:LolA family protein n=1 Tax=Actinoplanes sp. NPDC051851 TaxID=3154753 RepID=UPI00341B8D75